MARASTVGLTIYAGQVPRFEDAVSFAAEGFLAGGSVSNINYFSQFTSVDDAVGPHVRDVIFDAQTSGGLLMAVAPERVDALLERLAAQGVEHAAMIGEITADQPGTIRLRP